MKFIFFDWDPLHRQDKQYFYAIPFKPGWADILAEWEGDIRSVIPKQYQDALRLFVGEVHPEYTGKIYWGDHQEVGTDNEAKKELIKRRGKTVDELNHITLDTKEMWAHELIIPRNAIFNIGEADEITNLQYKEGKELRWIEICERFEYQGQKEEIEEHRQELTRIREKLKSLEPINEINYEVNHRPFA